MLYLMFFKRKNPYDKKSNWLHKLIFYVTYLVLLYSFYKNEIKPIYYNLFYNEINTSNFKDKQKLHQCKDIFESGSDNYLFSKLEPSEYVELKNKLVPLLYEFDISILNNINKIYLIDRQYLDSDLYIAGLTRIRSNAKEDIYISTENGIYIHTFYHEMFHVIYSNFPNYFNDEIRTEWLSINDYVSDYARSSLEEDICESGAMYMNGKMLNHPKVKLIAKYFGQLK